MAITYPRPCPKCGTKINNRSNFSRHRKHCEKKVDPVPCPHCQSTFTRKDDMLRHVKKFHSEAAKRKAKESAELLRLELLHADKVTRLSEDSQTGGAVTRGMKRPAEDSNFDVKELKPEMKPQEKNEEYNKGPTPLFVANVTKLGSAKRWKQNAVVNQNS